MMFSADCISLALARLDRYHAAVPGHVARPTRSIPEFESEEVAPCVILDYNEKDEVGGVEILYLSKRTPNLKTTALEFEAV
jgi:uncharacterized protein YuzE